MLLRLRHLSRSVDAASALRLMAEEKVLGDRQVRREVELLVNHRDAQTLGLDARRQRDRRSQPLNLACLTGHLAGQNLDDGRLPCSVLAYEPMNLSCAYVEASSLQDPDPA